MIPLAILGKHLFIVETASLTSISRDFSYSIASHARTGRTPGKQFVGVNDITVDLPGIIYPGKFGLSNFIDSINSEAVKGIPKLLITNHKGVGRVWGYWFIQQCKETATEFDTFNACRKIEFSIRLTFYGQKYSGNTEDFSLSEILSIYTEGSVIGDLF